MRGLSKTFLDEMRRRLDHGRDKGYTNWDRHWDSNFQINPTELMFSELTSKLFELYTAIGQDNFDHINEKTADIANFAMFIADLNKGGYTIK